ncbi:MAG: ABC transporter permease [Deltaproteobacteria bacterium]|nr:ABC transporter permease [Deltaproteobacteria bacterium]
MIVLARLRFFFDQALSGLWRSLGVSALAVLTIAVSLSLLATFWVIVENLSRVADELGRDVEIGAYVPKETPLERGAALASEITEWPGVKSARFVTSTMAMAELEESLGVDKVVLEGLPRDLVPPSIEVRLEERTWTVAEVRELAARLRAVDPIDDVRYGQEDVERVTSLLGFARVVAIVVGLALSLGVVILVSNTIRLIVYARRDEIEVLSLIGATDSFVRAPFVIEGAIQGALGAMLSTLVLLGMREVLTTWLAKGLSFAYGPMELTVDPLAVLALLFGVGIGLGLFGSLLAVGKFVRI